MCYRPIYGQVGLDQHSSVGAHSAVPSLTALYSRQSADMLVLLANLSFSDPLYHAEAGAPAELWLTYVVQSTPRASIDVRVEWFNKTATRLPEAFWLRFNSTARDVFQLNKLGVAVNASHVLNNGSAHLHGSAYPSVNSVMRVTPAANAAFLCLGETTPFPTPLPPRDPISPGISYNLVNNIWGTNYPIAYPFLPEDANTAYTFRIELLV